MEPNQAMSEAIASNLVSEAMRVGWVKEKKEVKKKKTKKSLTCFYLFVFVVVATSIFGENPNPGVILLTLRNSARLWHNNGSANFLVLWGKLAPLDEENLMVPFLKQNKFSKISPSTPLPYKLVHLAHVIAIVDDRSWIC